MTFGQYRPTLRPNRLSTLLLVLLHRCRCFYRARTRPTHTRTTNRRHQSQRKGEHRRQTTL